VEDVFKILMDIKSEIGGVKSDVKNMQEDITDLKQLITAIVRIEEKQIELESKQTKIDENIKKITQLEIQIHDIINEIEKFNEYLKERKQDKQIIKNKFFGLVFSLIERIIIYIAMIIIMAKEFFHK